MKLRILFIFFGPPAPPRPFENTKSRDHASRPGRLLYRNPPGCVHYYVSILFQHSRIRLEISLSSRELNILTRSRPPNGMARAGWKTIRRGGAGRGGAGRACVEKVGTREGGKKTGRKREKKKRRREKRKRKRRRKKKSLTFEGSRGLPKAMFLAGRKGFWHLKQTLTPSRLYPPYFSLTTSS